MRVQSVRPQKATPYTKTHHTTYKSLRLVQPSFAQLTLFANPQILCFTTIFNRPCNYIFPLSITNCISISSAIFAKHFTMCIKM